MPIDFNFQTLAMALSLVNLLQAMILFVQTRIVAHFHGAGWWTLGVLSAALGFLAVSVRGIPGFTPLGVIANNLCFVFGQACLFVGSRRFLGCAVPRRALGLGLSLYVAYDVVFVFIRDDLVLRGSGLYLTIAALSFWCAWTFWRHRLPSLKATGRFMVAAFFLHGIVFSSGFLLGLLFPPLDNNPMDRHPAQLLGLLDGLVVTTLWTFGCILMINQRLAQELEAQATTDILTGLKNRRYFVAFAEQEVQRSLRTRAPLALALIDFDRFKSINDAWGHPAGDEALVVFARRCQASIRGIDLLARFGGDEFAVFFPGVAPDQAQLVARRIREAVSGTPFVLQGMPVSVTVSVGLACAPAGTLPSFDDLFVRADQALYRAKKGGRNQMAADDGIGPEGEADA